MNGWPPCADIDWMLTIEPWIFSRFMIVHGALDEEERRAHVDVEDLVVALFGGVEDVAAIGQRGGVDEHVDAAEAAVGLGDHLAAVRDLGEVGADEMGRAARLGDFLGDALAVGGVAAADDEPRRAAFGEQPRDRLAEALRRRRSRRRSCRSDWRARVGRCAARRCRSPWRFLRCSRRVRLAVLRRRLRIMKQKFYSQVNMECVFFFCRRSTGSSRPTVGRTT